MFQHSPWKGGFMRQHNIEINWRVRGIRPPKVLKGHDDHVITCLQFSNNRIVSGSDDNTLKVSTNPLCISLLYKESRPRSEHIDRKTATFATFLSILSYKDALKCQAYTKAPFRVKSPSCLLKSTHSCSFTV